MQEAVLIAYLFAMHNDTFAVGNHPVHPATHYEPEKLSYNKRKMPREQIRALGRSNQCVYCRS